MKLLNVESGDVIIILRKFTKGINFAFLRNNCTEKLVCMRIFFSTFIIIPPNDSYKTRVYIRSREYRTRNERKKLKLTVTIIIIG